MEKLMEDFTKHESRPTPTLELKVQKNYQALVPRPSEEDYQRLKENIKRNGFDEAKPIVVTEDLVVLDGHTRLEIAKELGIEWVYTIVKELADHYAEKRYIIETNLDQRHLNRAQLVELGLKLEEIEQEEARERQRQAGEQVGKYNMKYVKKSQELEDDSHSYKLPLKSKEAYKQGEAREIAAKKVGIGSNTLWKGRKIKQAAETDPEVAEAWNLALQDKATINQVYHLVLKKENGTEAAETAPEITEAGELLVNQVYQQVQAKAGAKPKEKKPKPEPAWKRWVDNEPEEMTTGEWIKWLMRKEPDPPPAPDHDLMRVIYGLGEMEGISREEVDEAIALERSLDANGESFILIGFRWWSQKLLSAEWALSALLSWVERLRRDKRAARLEELPLPDDTKKLGPWVLDYVHRAQLEDLVREFPSDSVHLIYSDTVAADLDRLSLLGEFAARVLTEGKHLCVYVDKRQLPEAMALLSAAGLTYHWCCSVFRPEDKFRVEDRLVREKWRLLLVYRKGEGSPAPAWLDNADDDRGRLGEAAAGGWGWFDDAVEERRPSNRGLLRQLLKGLTLKGQLVVDPFVGSGITGQAARSLERRFLCFGPEEEDVRAANQRIMEMRLAEESGSAN